MIDIYVLCLWKLFHEFNLKRVPHKKFTLVSQMQANFEEMQSEFC